MILGEILIYQALIVVILPRLCRIKRDVPADAEAGLEVEAAGGGDGHIGLVKVDGAAVVGETLLEVEAGVEARRAAVVEKGVADELLGVEAGCETVIALFVVELDLRHDVVVGFDAQAVEHVATAELD